MVTRRIPTGFLVSRRTQDASRVHQKCVAYGIVTFFDGPFRPLLQLLALRACLACYLLISSHVLVYNPNKQARWFGLLRFAHNHYSGIDFLSLLLQVMRCFSPLRVPPNEPCIHSLVTHPMKLLVFIQIFGS